MTQPLLGKATPAELKDHLADGVCEGLWTDDEGNSLNCLDSEAALEESCLWCIAWHLVCEATAPPAETQPSGEGGPE